MESQPQNPEFKILKTFTHAFNIDTSQPETLEFIPPSVTSVSIANRLAGSLLLVKFLYN